MSNKTPPLVIPVVIDGTGVNRGLNNVQSRLRRGVSGGASGGGFGSGGGDAIAVAAAAGIGAGAAFRARGGRSVFGHYGSAGMVKLGGQNFGLTPVPAAARSIFGMSRDNRFIPSQLSDGFGDVTRERELYKMGRAGMRQSAYEAGDGYFSSFQNRVSKVGRAQAINAARRNANRNMRRRIVSDMTRGVKGAGNAFQGAVESGLGLKGMLGGVLSLATGKAAYDFFQNMDQYADPESAIGSPFYNNLRQSTIANANAPKRLGIMQGFIAGSNIANKGAGKSALQRHREAVQAGAENVGLSLGMAYEAAFTNTIGSNVNIIKYALKSLVN
jgi:hypothetical protein